MDKLRVATGLVLGIAGAILSIAHIGNIIESPGTKDASWYYIILLVVSIGYMLSARFKHPFWKYYQVILLAIGGGLTLMDNFESAYGHNMIIVSLALSILYSNKKVGRILPWIYLAYLTLAVGLAAVFQHAAIVYTKMVAVIEFYGILTPTGYFAIKYWRAQLLDEEIKRQATEQQLHRKKALLNLEPKLQAIGLTPKERELCLSATYFEGGQKRFAEELHINNGTMSAHLNHIYEKVGKYNFEDLRTWLQSQAETPAENPVT